MMPSPAEWSRADVIAALALLVSSLAFIASAVSSLVSWRSYLMTRAALRPRLRVYFEPFVGTHEWWIAHFEIHNPSDHRLKIESIRILGPWRACFSLFVGGYAGISHGGPMEYELPKEILQQGTGRSIKNLSEDDPPPEISTTKEMQHLADLFVKVPRWSLRSRVSFRVKVLELGAFPRQLYFTIEAPFPTEKNTPQRY
jgi:hypothetical protein